MNEHITIAALARQYRVSQTQLKDSFRMVYGTSVQGFICELKMKSAAEILRQTDRKIADIAAQFGYANASKFSTAFQRVIWRRHRLNSVWTTNNHIPPHFAVGFLRPNGVVGRRNGAWICRIGALKRRDGVETRENK